MSSRTAASIAAGVTAVAVVYTVALLMGVNDPDWAYLARPIIHLGEFTAVVALGLSGAAGPGRLGRIGIGAAALGTLVLAVAEVVYESSSAVGEALFGVGPTLVGIGLILAGVAVVRTALWNGWQRYITLVLGIYIFVVMTPVLTPLAALPRCTRCGPSPAGRSCGSSSRSLCWLRRRLNAAPSPPP